MPELERQSAQLKRISRPSAAMLVPICASLLMFSSLVERNVSAQETRTRSWPRAQLKSGVSMLSAFAPVAETVRDSVVLFEADGKPIALGTVVDATGLVVTKASELKNSDAKVRTASGAEIQPTVIAIDDDNDVALVRINATGLKPLRWTSDATVVGQWAITPGISRTPEAVGIVSVPPRKILHKRAFIGVQMDFNSTAARIAEVLSGLGAEKAGLKPGDLILQVNNEPVKTSEKLVERLRQFREGQTVKLHVKRLEEEFDSSIELMVPKPERSWRGASRQDRMNRLGGELSQRAEGFERAVQHDTVLQPWQCGGPLVDLEGHGIGINIARAGRVASYALPAELVQHIVEQLRLKDLPENESAAKTEKVSAPSLRQDEK
jgi:serine protease Do